MKAPPWILMALFSLAVAACSGGGGSSAPLDDTTTVSPALTDTGITTSQCYQVGSNVLVACNSAGALALNNQQDGMRGRDVSTPRDADGKLGFRYIAVGNYDKTECVQDDITGLMWEGKTASGQRAGSNVYTNYDSTTAHQWFNGVDYVAPTQRDIDAATNSIGYKNAVNAVALCGFTDWRLPTADELQSLVNYGVGYDVGASIDAIWFPNTHGYPFWSSSLHVGDASYAWFVDFNMGGVHADARGYFGLHVRLVRAGQ